MPRQVKNEPTREQRAAVALALGTVASTKLTIDWIQTGENAPSREFAAMAELLASRDASAEARGRLLERADMELFIERKADLFDLSPDIREALHDVAAAIERGDHLSAQPKDSAAPAVEVPALEQKCSACGGSGEHPDALTFRPYKCHQCRGSGKEPHV